MITGAASGFAGGEDFGGSGRCAVAKEAPSGVAEAGEHLGVKGEAACKFLGTKSGGQLLDKLVGERHEKTKSAKPETMPPNGPGSTQENWDWPLIVIKGEVNPSGVVIENLTIKTISVMAKLKRFPGLNAKNISPTASGLP